MFRLYHSNDLDVLKQLLIHDLSVNPPSPFQCEQIMVQSQGMAHWLKLNIADALGISAQIDFPLPSSFIWRIFNDLRPDLPQRSHFDKRLLTWKLMRLLPDPESEISDPDFAMLYQYQQGDNSGVKRYQLASNIADVFDQYLVYRPDWILNWEQGIDVIEGANVELYPWQPKLWRQLVADSRERGHSLDHRARLLIDLEDLVKEHGDRLIQVLPQRIFVFGIAALPSAYWQVLKAISSIIDVHYCAMNPCQNFWGDVVSERQRLKWMQTGQQNADLLDRGHPLLASWGRLGRDFLTMVHDQTLVTESNSLSSSGASEPMTADLFDTPTSLSASSSALSSASSADQQGGLQLSPEANIWHKSKAQNTAFELVDIDAYVMPELHQDRNLLGHIQDDLLQLNDAQAAAFSIEALEHSRFKRPIASDDDSVRLVLAHNPIREVQRLHDQLLQWLADDKTLEARDILIMVPDIDQYAPYVEAVFASVPEATRLPWTIADQSIRSENPLIEAFLSFIALADHRVLINDVIDWLELPAIQQKLRMADDQLTTVRQWLQQANVCWGLNAAHRQQLGVPEFDQNSWSRGLRQLLLGFVLADQQIAEQDPAMDPFYDELAIAALEGNQSELLGQLIEFIERLDGWREWLDQARPIDQWQLGLSRMIDDLFQSNTTDDASLQTIRDAVNQLAGDVVDADYQSLIKPAVLRQMLSDKLSQQGGWARFMAGSINVCTLMPMRSIPFRVVCLLGMNDEDYPRQVTPIGFDLMTAPGSRARRGDRSRRDDDRYLFLEAVCSAQDKLYISYRGFDARDNSERQPSVLVSELLDYACDSLCLGEDQDKPAAESHRRLRQWLIEECPLQPFSATAFDPDHARTPASYHSLWGQVALAGQEPVSRQKAEPSLSNNSDSDRAIYNPTEARTGLRYSDFANQALLEDPDRQATATESMVLAEDILESLSHPCRFYVQQIAGGNLGARLQELIESEPFDVDGLGQYKIRQQILQQKLTALNNSPLNSSQLNNDVINRRLQASGQLPIANFGQLSTLTIQQQADDVLDRCQPWLNQGVEPLKQAAGVIDLQAAGVPAGQFTELFISDYASALASKGSRTQIWRSGSTAIQVEASRFKAQHILQAWWYLVCQRLLSDPSISGQLASVPEYMVIISMGHKNSVWKDWSMLANDGDSCLLTIQTPELEVAKQWLAFAMDHYQQSRQQPTSHITELAGCLTLLSDQAMTTLWNKYKANSNSDMYQLPLQRCFDDIQQQLAKDGQLESWQSVWAELWQPIADAIVAPDSALPVAAAITDEELAND